MRDAIWKTRMQIVYRVPPDVGQQPIPETLIQSHNKLSASLIRYRSRRPRFKMFNGKPIDKFDDATKVLVDKNSLRKLTKSLTFVLNNTYQLSVNQPSNALSDAPHNLFRYTREFEEIKQLGEGGFGSVYEAYNKLDQKSYAIKKIPVDDSADEFTKVCKEVRTLAALENPYIVCYHSAWIENFNHENGLSLQSSNSRTKELSCSEDVDFEDSHSDGIVFAEASHVESSRNTVSKVSCVQNNGSSSSSSSSEEDLGQPTLLIQMELCHKTLTEWLQERNSSNEIVNDAQNRTIFLGILQGVVCIHSEDVIHRDLKPDNIFLKDGTHAKIGDFGLSTSKDQTTLKMNSSGTDYRNLTKGVGTYSYSSPEQQNGTKYDTKSDIYSLGLILYEMYHPFKTLMERNYLFKDLKKERKLSPFVSKEFPQKANLILAMTDLDPTKRPTAKKLLAQEKSPSEDEIIKDYEKLVAQLRERIKHLEREIMDQKHHS